MFLSPELTRRYELFVQQWDGLDAFDDHIKMQAPTLSNWCALSETRMMGLDGITRAPSIGQGGAVSGAEARRVGRRDGRAYPMDLVGETSDMEASWGRVGNMVGKKVDLSQVRQGRSFPRRFNTTAISPSARRRVCQVRHTHTPPTRVCSVIHRCKSCEFGTGRQKLVLERCGRRVTAS
jgi:hypothetical protein